VRSGWLRAVAFWLRFAIRIDQIGGGTRTDTGVRASLGKSACNLAPNGGHGGLD
jgi:hypothetical protein